jgi:hypothetical protein
MKIIEIIAGAQAGFNHPHESYANFRPSLTLKAIVEDGDDEAEAIGKLQQRAQDACDAEKTRILKTCRRAFEIQCTEGQITDLQYRIKDLRLIIDTYQAKIEASPDSWEIDGWRQSLAEAPENLEKCRRELAAARIRLAVLKPETFPVVVEMDLVEQCRCTLGDFAEANPDTIQDLAGVAALLGRGEKWVVPLGAGGVCVLRANEEA